MTSQQDIDDELALIQLLDEDQRFHRMLYFKAYPKQQLFFSMGAIKRERMFMAGNRVGKSEGAGFEDACHLTGDYPPDWKGVRFNHPIKMWVAGETGVDVRNIMQSKLCGQYGVVSAKGTGFIPKDRIVDTSLARGVTDAFDTVQVAHKTNGIFDGISICGFKSFEQGREKFQGEDLDFGHCDEEPPMEIYSEFLTRINGPGRMIITFTPLHGPTPLVLRFKDNHPDRGVVHMSLDEAEHFTEEEKRKKIEGYLSYQRDARRYGIPLLGEGAVFPYDEAMLKEPYLDYIPPHWAALWGTDFGIGHPFGAVLILWDRDNDVIHVHQALRILADERTPYMASPMFHAARMKKFGASVPVAWPHDGHQRKQGSGVDGTAALSSLYKAQGLRMLPTHSTHPAGGYEVEPIIKEIEDRILTSRFKVGAHLTEWFEEYRWYHRKDGLIVPENNDLLDATWKAIMMKRFAKAVPLGDWVPAKGNRGRTINGLELDAGDRYFGIDA
jgi:phage terminase large subunit-like protein